MLLRGMLCDYFGRTCKPQGDLLTRGRMPSRILQTFMTWLTPGMGVTYLKLRRQCSSVGSTYLANSAVSRGLNSVASSLSIQLSTTCTASKLSVLLAPTPACAANGESGCHLHRPGQLNHMQQLIFQQGVACLARHHELQVLEILKRIHSC